MMIPIIILTILFLSNSNNIQAALTSDIVSEYREKGFDAQRQGEFNRALEFYQKAIQINPDDAMLYNDIGVLYETKGELDPAEKSYLKAIQLDSQFLAAYYNLGCLYENKGDYQEALKYFTKRVELDISSSLWAKKAQGKIEEIDAIVNLVSEDIPIVEEQIIEEPQAEPISEPKDEEPKEIVKDIIIEKLPKEPKPLIYEREIIDPHLERAQEAYDEMDYLTAQIESNKALQLNPYNKEAEKLLKKAQRKLLVE